MDKEELPLTRDDFPDKESWLRHCYEGGIDLAREAGEDFAGLIGTGLYGHRLSSIYGATRLDYLRAWGAWGVSRSLQWQQFKKGYEAVAFANCMGVVLDTTLDITWSLQGITSDRQVADSQKAFLDAIRRWLERHDRMAAFYWVLERGARRGLHTHIALHVPDTKMYEFNTYSRATLAHIVKGPLHHVNHERTLYFQPRRGGNIFRQWQRFTYMMKGLDENLMWLDKKNPAASARVKDWKFIPFKPQGEIAVKRMGVSRILDIASRRRWSALNDLPSMIITKDGPPLDDRYLKWFHENEHRIIAPGDAG